MSSINVYLHGEEVRDHEGFQEQDDTRECSLTNYSISGYKINYDGLRFFITLTDLDSPIPEVLDGLIEEVSLRTSLSTFFHREAGIYKLGPATAEVPVPIGGVNYVTVKIKGPDKDCVASLWRQIQLGSIRPEPEGSFECSQSGKSRAELEAEIQELKGVLNQEREYTREQGRIKHELEAEVERLTRSLADAERGLERVREFSDELGRSSLRWCNRERVTGNLNRLATSSPYETRQFKA